MKANGYSFSVAMATYCGQRFLPKQLDSIAAQTRLPNELVVTDDSPDSGTLDILIDFAKRAPFPVRIFKNETRLGYAANFLKALSLCRGELIALCDQDDVWNKRKIERSGQTFEDQDVLLVMHRVKLVDENLDTLPQRTLKHWSLEGRHKPLTTNPWSIAFGMSMIIRRSLLDWAGYPDLEAIRAGFGHDGWLWCAATSLGVTVGLSEELALYRQHGSNAVGALKSQSSKEALLKSKITGSSHYADLASTSQKLSEHLCRISAEAPRLIQDRARRATEYYRALSGHYQLRATLYKSRARAQRLKTFSRLLLTGAYRPMSRSGLGSKALIKDVVISVVQNKSIP